MLQRIIVPSTSQSANLKQVFTLMTKNLQSFKMLVITHQSNSPRSQKTCLFGNTPVISTKPARLSGLWAKIWTQNIPNMKQGCKPLWLYRIINSNNAKVALPLHLHNMPWRPSGDAKVKPDILCIRRRCEVRFRPWFF